MPRERESETVPQCITAPAARETGNCFLSIEIERAKIIDPMAVIGMFVGPDDGCRTSTPFRKQLFAQVRRRVDQDTRCLVLNQDRNPPSSVPGFERVTLAPFSVDPGDA